jgi:hypothetical protein
MNTYKKYCPNVFVAKCEEEHSKGSTIILTTKYGQEHENEVHSFLGKTADNFFLYSITRADGFNAQKRAENKVEKLEGYAANAEKRSTEAWEASHEGKDFLSLGEPIKIGHHSERRHRALIARNWARMDKSVAESQKAEDYRNRTEYWKGKANEINLSMPESLNFYEFKLEEAKKKHKFLKDNPEARAHSYSLTYANKEVKETEKNLNLAVKLWGTDEEIQQIDQEKKEQAEAKAGKGTKMNKLIEKYNGYFAFNKDQLLKGHAKLKEEGHIEEGEKVTHIRHGLYIPVKHKDAFINEL